MPKKRVSGSASSSRRLREKNLRPEEKEVSHWLYKSLNVKEFIGISLGGGKTDKTCIAVVEYYPEQNKIFLRHLEDKIKSTPDVNADDRLFQFIQERKDLIETIAVDVPLQLPKCIRCTKKCPGYQKCKEPEILYMHKIHKQSVASKKMDKGFAPYTERLAEFYVNRMFEEKFHLQQALGANMAPLTTRAVFLQRRLKLKMIEAVPSLSLWRIGRSLGLQKSDLRVFDKSFEGQEARAKILEQLINQDLAFVYTQDLKLMIEKPEPFDAFLCGLTAVLEHKGLVEKRPVGYPKKEAWISMPLEDIDWSKT